MLTIEIIDPCTQALLRASQALQELRASFGMARWKARVVSFRTRHLSSLTGPGITSCHGQQYLSIKTRHNFTFEWSAWCCGAPLIALSSAFKSLHIRLSNELLLALVGAREHYEESCSRFDGLALLGRLQTTFPARTSLRSSLLESLSSQLSNLPM